MISRSLHHCLAVFLIALLGCVLLLFFILRWESQARMSRDLANRAYLNIQQQLRAEAEERNEIAHDWPRYRQLQQRGFIADENRSAWIYHLSDIAARHHWPPIEYEFANPQIALDLPSAQHLRNSAMRLHLLLPHEEAFLQLFEALPSETLAPVIPRQCTLLPASFPHRSAGIEVYCEFQWLTLAAPKAAI